MFCVKKAQKPNGYEGNPLEPSISVPPASTRGLYAIWCPSMFSFVWKPLEVFTIVEMTIIGAPSPFSNFGAGILLQSTLTWKAPLDE